jgi:CRP/FNR family nitrogen fixation transcriptional regulator
VQTEFRQPQGHAIDAAYSKEASMQTQFSPARPSHFPVRSISTDSEGSLSACGAVQHFAQDGEIYAEGEDADRFFKVMSGTVRVCKFLDDGRRQIEAFHVAGDVFGLEVGDEYSMTAEAVSDCTLVCYRRQSVERMASSVVSMSGQLFAFAMNDLRRARQHALLLGRRGAVEKVAAFLLEMTQNKDATVVLAMSRQDIADYLGLTIETVSRALSQLERDGIIALPSTRQIHLRNQASLRALAA